MANLNSKKLLESSGTISDWRATGNEFLSLPGDTAPGQIPGAALEASTLLIEFSSSADGRGFSLAPTLRSQAYRGRLVAAGSLIPDQVSLAFQCGFDAALVTPQQIEHYGWNAWQAALAPIVKLGYASFASTSVKSVWWERRAQSRSGSR